MITREQLRAALTHRRPGVTSDEDWGQLTVIKEYEHLPIKDKVLLDVGGNIGAFAVRAAMEGCKKVITYEPHPENFTCLSYNTYPWAEVIHPVRAALVTTRSGEIPLYITNERTLGSCSIEEFRGRSKIMVPAVNFGDVLDLYKPDGIKMDCEGAEWKLLNVPLPDCVKDVAAELHFTKKYWREDCLPHVLRKMEEEGFELIRAPVNTGKNFHTIAHWRRA